MPLIVKMAEDLILPHTGMSERTQKVFGWLGVAGVATALALTILSRITPAGALVLTALSVSTYLGGETKRPVFLVIPAIAAVLFAASIINPERLRWHVFYWI